MTKKKGTLQYDRESDRFDIHFDDGKYYGGLHCGECLDVRLNESGCRFGLKWMMTGILWSSEDPAGRPDSPGGLVRIILSGGRT